MQINTNDQTPTNWIILSDRFHITYKTVCRKINQPEMYRICLRFARKYFSDCVEITFHI